MAAKRKCQCGGRFRPYVYDKSQIRCDLCARPAGETAPFPDYRDIILAAWQARCAAAESELAGYKKRRQK